MSAILRDRAFGTVILLLSAALSACTGPGGGLPGPAATASPAGACGLLDRRDEVGLDLVAGTRTTAAAPPGVRTWACTYTSTRSADGGDVVVEATEADSLDVAASYRDDLTSGLPGRPTVLGRPAFVLDQGSSCVVVLQAAPEYAVAVEAPASSEQLDRTTACAYSTEVLGAVVSRNPDLPARLLDPGADEPGGVSFAQPVAAMEPTVGEGQQVDADAVAGGYTGAVGDVVVFRPADGWSDGATTPVALRVVAVGGQTVGCCDARNRVLVDGSPIDEAYVYYDPAGGPSRQAAFGPVAVPAGTVWLMGDNRNNSGDSRVPGRGPVPIDWIVGVVPR